MLMLARTTLNLYVSGFFDTKKLGVGAQREHRELKLAESVEQCQDRASKLDQPYQGHTPLEPKIEKESR
jgi:hypothetical protein